MKAVVAVFLMLHGLAHAVLAMVPNPKASEPAFATFFAGMGSWLFRGLSTSSGKVLATVLAAVATLGFVGTGLSLFDLLLPLAWWRVLAIASAIVSALLLVVFWDRYMIVGLLIDVAVLVTLLLTRWSPV